MSRKKVSVITVCRNEVHRIERTLQSVVSQTFLDFEYIVIDGDSKDGTKWIIESYQTQIDHYISEPDGGIFAAQNKGLRLAQGEYVIFINGGDAFYERDVLETVFKFTNYEDILYGDLWIEDHEQGEYLGKSPEKINLNFLLRGTLWHPVSFIRRSLFERFGFYREDLKIVSDYQFFLKVIGIHDVTTKYLDLPISRFDTQGIGSRKEYAGMHKMERDRVQKELFSRKVLELNEECEFYQTEIGKLHKHIAFLENKYHGNS